MQSINIRFENGKVNIIVDGAFQRRPQSEPRLHQGSAHALLLRLRCRRREAGAVEPMPAAELIHLIGHELPQFWQRHIFWFFTTSLAVPVLFFQTRFERPSVHIAVKPRAALFMCPPKPTPDFLVLLDTCCMLIVTFSLPQLGHIIITNLRLVFINLALIQYMCCHALRGKSGHPYPKNKGAP